MPSKMELSNSAHSTVRLRQRVGVDPPRNPRGELSPTRGRPVLSQIETCRSAGSASAAEPGVIAVATVALADVPGALWPCLVVLLSEAELGCVGRFHFLSTTVESMWLRTPLSGEPREAAGGAPRGWAFAAKPCGKPFVAGGRGPHFNLSHCGGLVVCAVSPDVPLGVDVERRDRTAPLDVAKGYFASAECTWLFGLPRGRALPWLL